MSGYCAGLRLMPLLMALSAGPVMSQSEAHAGFIDDWVFGDAMCASAYCIWPLFAIEGGTPQKARGSFQLLVGSFERGSPIAFRTVSGFVIGGTAGASGGTVDAGYAWNIDRVIVGFDLKVSVLRSWGSPVMGPAGQTGVGVAGGAQFSLLRGTVGLYRPIDGGPPALLPLVTAGVAF